MFSVVMYSGDVAVLAASCQRLLKRVHSNGPRALLPSRLEVSTSNWCILIGGLVPALRRGIAPAA